MSLLMWIILQTPGRLTHTILSPLQILENINNPTTSVIHISPPLLYTYKVNVHALFYVCFVQKYNSVIFEYLNWEYINLTSQSSSCPSLAPGYSSENIRADLKLISHNWIKTQRQLRKMKKIISHSFLIYYFPLQVQKSDLKYDFNLRNFEENFSKHLKVSFWVSTFYFHHLRAKK